MRRLAAGLLLLLALAAPALAAPALDAERAPDLILRGTLTRRDHQTWRDVPFRVPAGVVRLTLAFSYSGREQRAVIDVGLRDPRRLRGWSGGNKDRVVIEEADATPSYLPGPITAGMWTLLLGVPNLRAGASAAYEAKVWFDRAGDTFPGFSPAPVRAGPGWYRGDLHLHTAHSDGSCRSSRGVSVPCPVFRTLEAAQARGLDFVAVSDHNTISQAGALRELAPYFDDLLIIPAREITTFHGHFNVIGPTGSLDFQPGSARAASVDALFAEAAAAHGLVSINHPGLPSGESCMGCGWTAPEADVRRVQAIEVVNGGALKAVGSAEGPFSSLPFWEGRLNAGLRITGVGGSDNHDADQDPGRDREGVGRPATVVHAAELSQAAILEAIRAGHVFVDVEGVPGRLLTVRARTARAWAEMGDVLPAAAGERVEVAVEVKGAPSGAMLSLAGDGARLATLPEARLGSAEAARGFTIVADGQAHWLRVDVRDAQGRLVMIGNPLYLRPPR